MNPSNSMCLVSRNLHEFSSAILLVFNLLTLALFIEILCLPIVSIYLFLKIWKTVLKSITGTKRNFESVGWCQTESFLTVYQFCYRNSAVFIKQDTMHRNYCIAHLYRYSCNWKLKYFQFKQFLYFTSIKLIFNSFRAYGLILW